ncbi:Calpain-5 [Trichoplax sp. H2]|uniref:Calpain catalytic domain-containing protein n=1 Tax=Trichoplax adhaerens TaxID=10228 RepID=B3RIE5_TRIAD|nr:expressed hypothetical protein [Trichoplax adhaerens]EDV28402.1 expressed hypothetical protein [Trichoplax adhaerens]RDD40904.1 Calpain-5 [Trichoplax sp. H2]|eukprot:XP_002107604.1 expressed hypothetical protein [Trichoplax adhaerens]
MFKAGYTAYLGQNYTELKKKAKESGKPFADAEFPADRSSLFVSKDKQVSGPLEWKRPTEITDNPKFFVDGTSPSDVTQGHLGNCWFVAACASLSQEKSLVNKVIPNVGEQDYDTSDGEHSGIVHFRFWRFGEWVDVVIDDRLPMVDGKLIYVHSKQKNEFWSALLEKAYAKLAGSYESLEAGNTADALVDFTGGIAETIKMDGEDYSDDNNRDQLFKLMDKSMDRHALICCSIRTADQTKREERTDMGLILLHAYGVTKVTNFKLGEGLRSFFRSEKVPMVRMRNPWGKGEWKGAWSDGSEEWNRVKKSEREKVGLTFEEDGEFWMSFEDFTKYYTHVTICRVINTSFMTIHKIWKESTFHGCWSTSANRAGGCINNRATFLQNPQYAFDVTDGEYGTTVIALMQKDKRLEKRSGHGENLSIGYYIMKVAVNRNYRLHTVNPKAADVTYSNSREVTGRFELEAGRYVIIPSTFQPGEDGEFLLRMYTENSAGAKELVKSSPTGGGFCGCFSKSPVAIVQIDAIAAKDLSKKNRSGVGASPYCIIKCGKESVRTPVIKETLNPKFDASAIFYLRNPNSAKAVIEIWSKGTVMDSFMGKAEIAVELNRNKVCDDLPLFSNKKPKKNEQPEKEPGTLSVKINCSDNLEEL